jgi:hypothetical protein
VPEEAVTEGDKPVWNAGVNDAIAPTETNEFVPDSLATLEELVEAYSADNL